jgi:O-methyltransferase domain/Dimerisation domain
LAVGGLSENHHQREINMSSSDGFKPAALSMDHIWQLGFGFWSSKSLLSAVELGVFTALAKGPLDAEELRQRLDISERSARDFFDVLVSLGLLDRDQGKYLNTPETDHFLDRGKSTYIGGILEMCSVRLFGFWASLTEGLKTGKPQSEARHGQSIYDMVYSKPELVEPFVSSMTGYSQGTAIALAEKFPWQDYRSFADLGTAQGAIPVQIALAHSHLSGAGFDLPPVQGAFERYVARNGVADRVKFQSGDFFVDPMPGADVLVMGHILHNWALDTRKTLLKRAWDALPQGGALIVYESLIDDDRRTHTIGLLQALNMMIETEHGSNFTGAECQSWMHEAGFRDTRVEHLSGADWMVVGLK